MITKTSEHALRVLQYVAGTQHRGLVPLREVAQELRESPSYIAKIARELVKAGILRAGRGVRGGVVLTRSPEQITLLEVVEACQGSLLADHCQARCAPEAVCSYHQAAVELRDAMAGVLERWSLARLMARPWVIRASVPCTMAGEQNVATAPETIGGTL